MSGKPLLWTVQIKCFKLNLNIAWRNYEAYSKTNFYVLFLLLHPVYFLRHPVYLKKQLHFQNPCFISFSEMYNFTHFG